MAFDPSTLEIASLPSLPLSERKSFPAVACIYFAMKGSQILYIGQTADLFYRFRSHGKKEQFVESGCEKIHWLSVDDKRERPRLESRLIHRLKPILNTEYRERRYLPIERTLKREIIKLASDMQITTDDLLRYSLELVQATREARQ